MSELNPRSETVSIRSEYQPCQQELQVQDRSIKELQNQIAKMDQEMRKLDFKNEVQQDEICALDKGRGSVISRRARA